MAHTTVDEAIEKLVAISRQGNGSRPLVFGDGSPVQFVVSDAQELSPERFDNKVVQVRLDKAALAART